MVHTHRQDMCCAVKVVILMTMPVKLGKHSQEILDVLHVCKAAFTDPDILGLVTSLCHAPLAKFPDLSEDDRKTLQLFLTFVRNLARIPDAVGYERASSKFYFSTLTVRTPPDQCNGA
jgi:hypothetical protein